MKLTHSFALAATLVGATFGLATSASAETLANIEHHKSINIGVQTDYPPYGYIGSDMKPQGSDIATAELIAKKLGVKLNIVTLTSPNRIPSLQSGKVDLVIASMGKNPEREKVVDFTIAYAPFYSGLYAAKSLTVKGFPDTAGKTVAVTRGSIQDNALEKLLPKEARIQRYEDDTSTVQSFVSGQSQILATSASVAGVAMAKNPQINAEYKVLLTSIPCYIGVAKGNKELLDKVNGILRAAKADGTLNAISEKYLGQPLGNLPE